MPTPSSLKPGDPAPDFCARDQNGNLVRLSDFAGKRLVLFFYPKDDTPGCTKEACGFRDLHPQFVQAGWCLLGVSPDSPTSHQKFIAKFQLPFPLLSDEDKTIAQAYGVWVEKSLYGRKYMGVERSTFVIGPEGRLEAILRKVQPASHPQQLLKSLTTAPS